MRNFEKFQENNFHSFFGETAEKFRKGQYRAARRKQKREINYGHIADFEDRIPAHTDSYSLFEKTFYVKGIPIVVRDKLLADCLQYIVPNRRNVLLLSFFAGYNKSRIAELLNISNPTVAYRLDVGVKEMKEQILRRKAYEEKGSV